MRIEQVRFKNLNSLVGEWTIDFTDPSYVSEGIFAITGPTGAGKTTILDALCLALYGRTPRLSTISKSTNELMSRHTGECFAEVTFTTQEGSYRCTWSQRRARKKANGALQSPKQEIVDAVTGEVLEEKLRDVSKEIEARTGMDYERFTQSILLAQGGFAAFLLATPGERAPILEQITGTAIYTVISKQVHERLTEENNKLQLLQAELGSIQLMSEEEEKQLADTLNMLRSEDTKLRKTIDQTRTAWDWLHLLHDLEQELKTLNEGLEEMRQQQKMFAPHQEQLRLANQAYEAEADYVLFDALRRNQKNDEASLVELQRQIEQQRRQVEKVEASFQETLEQLGKKKTQQKELHLTLIEVRKMDSRFLAQKGALIQSEELVRHKSDSLKGLQVEQTKRSYALAACRQEAQQLHQELENTRVDASLESYLPTFFHRIDDLTKQSKLLLSKKKALQMIHTQYSELQKKQEGKKPLLAKLLSKLSDEKKWLEQKRSELKKLLSGRLLTDWRAEHTEQTARLQQLKEIERRMHAVAKQQEQLSQYRKTQQSLLVQQKSLEKSLEQYKLDASACHKEKEQCERHYGQLRTIQLFEQARGQLKKGDPCPLCGACEHPFAAGDVPQMNDAEVQLAEMRVKLDKARDAVASVQRDLAVQQKELEYSEQQIQSLSKNLHEEELQLHEALVGVKSKEEDTAVEDLPARLRDMQSRLAQVDQVIQQAQTLEEEITALRDVLEAGDDSLRALQSDALEIGHQLQSAEQDRERSKKEIEGLNQELRQSTELVLKELSPYGITQLSLESVDAVKTHLEERKQQWLKKQITYEQLQREIETASQLEKEYMRQIEQAKKQLVDQQESGSMLQKQYQKLLLERQALFGDKDTDQEEQLLAQELEQVEQKTEKGSLALQEAGAEQTKSTSRLDHVEEQIQKRQPEIEKAKRQFLCRLADCAFADEATYLKARMPEAERRILQEKAQKLVHEQAELEFKKKHKSDALREQQAKKLTQEPIEQLQQALQMQQQQVEKIQQELGAKEQSRKDNQEKKEQQTFHVARLESQSKENRRWKALHDLIGSADGAKFRKFAQGLTFEIMVHQANIQLQKMTKRYLLHLDKEHPLELFVIDDYQGGEQRSTKNLSGGESFLVSLALALGLSQMASKNVRVDSLFLDEGFGTLDEAALDTALETLASLQQDGKIVGVISHVPALKERISTQIHVECQSGGKSVLYGPGVTLSK